MVNTVVKNRNKIDIPKTELRRIVVEVIRDIFNDPDYGLPLTPYTIKRLKKSIKSKKRGRLIGLDEILKKEKIKSK